MAGLNFWPYSSRLMASSTLPRVSSLSFWTIYWSTIWCWIRSRGTKLSFYCTNFFWRRSLASFEVSTTTLRNRPPAIAWMAVLYFCTSLTLKSFEIRPCIKWWGKFWLEPGDWYWKSMYGRTWWYWLICFFVSSRASWRLYPCSEIFWCSYSMLWRSRRLCSIYEISDNKDYLSSLLLLSSSCALLKSSWASLWSLAFVSTSKLTGCYQL